MSIKKISSFWAILFLAAAILPSCRESRQVVPCDIDLDEIYRPLIPNDEDNPQNLSFGSDSIPGFIFNYEIPSDNNDIYIYLDNLTVLDVNPAITQDIFDFIQDQLKEFGFVNDSVPSLSDKVSNFLSDGLAYTDAAGSVIDVLQKDFEEELPEIEKYDSPFNANFRIYPLYIDKTILTYRLSSYCYTGGAHGTTVSYIRSYDLKTGKVLTFSDIVKPESQMDVREEVAARMAYAYPIYENITTVEQYIDSLNVWLDNFNDSDSSQKITAKDFPIEDVALIKQGLVSVYQMYELTPGSDGCPVVVVPYEDIKGCLNY